MNKKRIVVFLIFILVLMAANVSAHDKGDLMLHIEPQIGYTVPDISIKSGGIALDKDMNTLSFGFNYALMGTVHYYFVNFFGVNAGVGYSGFVSFYNISDDDINFDQSVFFSASYFTIPFGVRFSLGALAVGAGLTGNFPMGGGSSWLGDTDFEDKKFELNSYLGWYADIGFDMSGRKGRGGGFGILFRFSGSTTGPIASTGRSGIDYDRFDIFSMSLVFSPAIQLASLPIGGK